MTLCAIISTRSFLRKMPIHFKIFSLFMIISIIVEIFAISWKWGLHDTKYWNYNRSNLWIYNAFFIMRYLFTITFFLCIIKSIFFKKIIKKITVFLTVFSVINYLFIQTPFQINSHTIILANVLLISVSLSFFNEIYEIKKGSKLYSIPEIWIVLGVFIYYTGTLPFFILFNSLINSNSPMLNSFLFINDTLNVVMYSLYLTAYLCRPQILK